MTETKKRPNIRFAGFTEDWEQRKLGEVAQYRNGKAHENCIDEKGKYIVVNSKFISTDGEVKKFSNKKNEALFVNEIAFVLSDVPNGRAIARTFLVEESGKYTLNQRIAGITPIGETSPYFLHILMNRHPYFLAFDDGAKQTNLSVSDVMGFEAYYPKYSEQRKIGTYFRNLDNLITLYQRKYNKLTAVKKSMLEKMFPKNGRDVPEIRFKGFTEPWEQRKLGEVGTTYTGLSGKTKEDFGHGSGQFVTYMNVFSNSVASSKMIEPVEIDDRQNKVVAGDVLFTTSSETPEEVGMSSVWLENSENTYLNSFCFGYRPSIPFDPYYLAYMLRSSSMRKKITFLAQGISRYNISKNKMMDIEIPVPTMREQQQVGEYFRNLDNLITLYQHKLTKLQNIKKSMLERMFI